ncbi:leucine-rich repeat and immunoglobulin-like domain-containing nogo receptor-interacting protein 2b isoform X2 [Astyanax mexicanus]|uniref:leucine-rich repeat and immunoglobulin-like domain-containing nogo receptor-interacting protein 2b isoform X2 n=1 Tax=Astyanax mexicanus TaxID=7994 RepID=UPI0020CAECFA|nr:leucine-rich repeat and immunoglobulin-like domain-containing nogo receptor-interacting protein 2b isoform X2 [Astyanax mexicanus]
MARSAATAFQMEEAPKILVTLLLDGREICKKIHHLNSAAEIIDGCKHLLPCTAEFHRILKFNPDFNEYIDTDLNDSVQSFDKFQVLFNSITPSGTLQWAGQLNTDAAGPSNQIKVGPLNRDVAGSNNQQQHGQGPVNADRLRALIQIKGPSILADYEASGTLSETSRKLLVKIGVGDLVEQRGFYPSNEEKLMLAKNVVTLFPSLKIKMGEENEGFEHFFDPVSHSGFIEIKLRNLRRSLHDSQRRYRRKRTVPSNTSFHPVSTPLQTPAEEEEESTVEWMTAMKRMKPSHENFSTIKLGMEKTFDSRRFWIVNSSPTAEEIFQQYPHFIDMPYLLDIEFEKMYPGKADLFLQKWEGSIVPKLLKMATMKDNPTFLPSTAESDGPCFRALQMLTYLLPPTASGRGKGWTKCSVKSAISYILDIKPPGSSGSRHLDPDRAVKNQQPHLLCLGDPSTTAQYIIVAENNKVAIPLEDNSLTCAIDKLFKMYCVCNLAYPAQLTSVFNFFEHIYDMPISGGKRCKVVELIARIQAML